MDRLEVFRLDHVSGDAVVEVEHRRTEPRRRLIDLIARLPGQFRAADLIDRAQAEGIGRATVFRLIDQLVRIGVLERWDGPEGCRTYTLREPECRRELVCRACGEVTPIESPALEAQIRSAARDVGFRVDAHNLDVLGLCAECQDAG